MSKLKSMPRGAWLVVGLAIGVLLIPTAVGATVAATTALKYTGIEGSSGSKADVTAGGQLLTTPAKPSLTWTNSNEVDDDNLGSWLATSPPSGYFPVLTQLIVNFYAMNSPGSNTYLNIYNDQQTIDIADLNPATVGVNQLPFSPGIPLEDGYLYFLGQGIGAWVEASGYYEPCSDLPSAC